MSSEELRAELLDLFARELRERADRVEGYLSELAATPEPGRRDALVDALALEGHNLVGTARTLGLHDAEDVAAGLEALAGRIGRGETVVTEEVVATVAGALRSLVPAVT